MRYRKITAFVLAIAALVLLLSGCGGNEAVPTVTPEPSSVVTPEPISEATPVPTATPEPEEPLPDVDITSWEFVVANPHNYIGHYAPISTSFFGQLIDVRIADIAHVMIDDAAVAGYTLYVTAAFRSFDYYENYRMSLIDGGMTALEAQEVTFAGGCSDHTTGLAIDFTTKMEYNFDYDHRYDPDFENTEAFQWLLEHCAEYGFVQRYPEGKEEFYYHACCPGHFRYVGVEAAKYMTEQNLCLEEFVALYK